MPTAQASREQRIRIGGVEFVLSSGDAPISREVEEPYRSFVAAAPSGAGEAVQLRFQLSPSFTFEGKTIFHSEALWTIRARDGERALEFREPSAQDPLYVAVFRPTSSEVVVHCSDRTFERDGSETVLRNLFHYPFDQLLCMYTFSGRGLILHAAGHLLEGRGVAFSGISGAGKTTITGLLRGRPGWMPLSDDRLFMRLEGNAVVLHGTPWPGEGRVAEAACGPMRHLLFLEKGPVHTVRRIGAAECLERLFPVVSVPWFDAEFVEDGLAACARVAERVPAAVLTFRPDAGAVEAMETFLASSTEQGRH